MYSGNFLPSASKQVPDVYSHIPAISGQEFWLKLVTQVKGSEKEPNISIYFFFPPITQLCSISDVLFTGEMGESD